MDSYLNVIGIAAMMFPFLAVLITLPYMLFQYKKFGAIPLLRTAVVYSFVLYCMTAYFLAVLPLPDPQSVAAMTSPTMNLVPGASLWEFLEKYPQDFSTFNAYVAVLKSDAFREMFFNVCMFFPLGVYLRYYFRRKAWQATLIGFLCSLFLELTQLSALYGLYARPYRLFDVNDLINNTLGALLGWALAPLICFFLPSREELDRRAYQKGQKVPFLRRVLALALDWLFLYVLYLAGEAVGVRLFPALRQMQWAKALIYAVGVFGYFVLLQWLCRGRTPGKAFLHLRLVDDQGRRPRLWQYLVRYTLLYGVLLPMPWYAAYAIDIAVTLGGTVPMAGGLAVGALCAVVICAFFAGTLSKLLGSEHEYLYGRISRTHNVSTLRVPVAPAAPEDPAGPGDGAGPAEDLETNGTPS